MLYYRVDIYVLYELILAKRCFGCTGDIPAWGGFYSGCEIFLQSYREKLIFYVIVNK